MVTQEVNRRQVKSTIACTTLGSLKYPSPDKIHDKITRAMHLYRLLT